MQYFIGYAYTYAIRRRHHQISAGMERKRKVVDDIHDFSPVCSKSNTTGATCGAGTAWPSGSHDLSPVAFSKVHVGWSLLICVMFCWSVFVILAIAFIIRLRLTAYDYHFGIFKLQSTLSDGREAEGTYIGIFKVVIFVRNGNYRE